ncbi:MAG: OsmC family protein [Alphaproteobacteria bacterium]|nr:OsmC family protein [Alphaproteobacteria bacterium]
MGLYDQNEISVTEIGKDNFAQSIRMGKHIIIADEPEAFGGKDSGPNPYDLLLASLGACTSITLRMYALRENIPLKTIHISLNHQKVDDNDLIYYTVYVEGDFTSTQKDDLLKVVENCPIHKILERSFTIKTALEIKKD